MMNGYRGRITVAPKLCKSLRCCTISTVSELLCFINVFSCFSQFSDPIGTRLNSWKFNQKSAAARTLFFSCSNLSLWRRSQRRALEAAASVPAKWVGLLKTHFFLTTTLNHISSFLFYALLWHFSFVPKFLKKFLPANLWKNLKTKFCLFQAR